MGAYTMQVRVQMPDKSWQWRDVHPTHGTAYVYATRAEAESMLRMCYPDCAETQARVSESKAVL